MVSPLGILWTRPFLIAISICNALYAIVEYTRVSFSLLVGSVGHLLNDVLQNSYLRVFFPAK